MPEIPIKYLKYIDNTGNVQKAYGITVLKAVYDADGNTLDEILQTYDNKVGDTSSLTTTANTDLVSAINEVDGNVGDLSGLSTTAKNNLVSAVNELNQNMNTEYEKILEITELTGSGTIPGFSNYKEFVIVISASGYVASHYLVKNMLTYVNLHSSYYYDSAQHAMAAIRIDLNGTYTLAPGMEQNSNNSTVVIYAR